MRKTFTHALLATFVAVTVCLTTQAQPATGYYDNIDGLQKVELKKALRIIISDHKRLSYSSSLPDAYPYVYYCDPLQKGSSTAKVYDLFSDEVYPYTSTTMWNKEHVIPKSWWGGSTSADQGCDLFSVIPSLQTANSSKSNYPPGIVDKSYSKLKDSGRQYVGPAISGTGGKFSNVWEPYDEYKGDFARIVMYVATCYANVSWDSTVGEMTKGEWPTMNEWLYKLMLQWHEKDPVSDKEKQINDDVFAQQGNRNPFIDYPVLAQYIWGDKTSKAFILSEAILYSHGDAGNTGVYHLIFHANGGSSAPRTQATDDGMVTVTTALPVRAGYTFVGWNTKADGTGTAYHPGSTYTLTADVTLYAQWQADGGQPSDTPCNITLLPGGWELVTSTADLIAGDRYVLACYEKNVVAAAIAPGNAYMSDAKATFSADHLTIEALPDEASVFTLGGKQGAWTLTASGGVLGATTTKKLAYGKGTATWSITIDGNADATIQSTTDAFGRFLYNAGAPRFTTYTSATNASMLMPQLYHQVAAGCQTTIGPLGYATLYAPFNVTVPQGITAYVATLDGTTLQLADVGSVIPAETAVILQGAAGTYAFAATAESAFSGLQGDLQGVHTPTPCSELATSTHYAYVLADGSAGAGFYRLADDATLAAGRAWLPVNRTTFGASAIAIRPSDVTAIGDPTPADTHTEAYDLLGRPAQPNRPGIFIMGGRKVIFK